MPSVYYRTEDPVENFKLKVGIREVSRPKVVYSADSVRRDGPFSFDSILTWQHKLYSPSDIADYLHNKDSKFGTVAQFETRRHFADLERSGQDVSALLGVDAMLYTYVAKDHHNDLTSPPTTHAEGYESYLGAAAAASGGSVSRSSGSSGNGGGGGGGGGFSSARQRDLSNKLFKDKPFKTMHICLATDIDQKALTDRRSWWALPQDQQRAFSACYTEHVLCSIKLYQDGLLEVSPALSTVAEEGPAGTPHDATNSSANGHSIALSAFMSDRTAEAGIKRGFLLSTLRVRAASGCEFEYSVSNAQDVLVPHRLDEILRAQAAVDAARAAQNRGSLNWKQDPPPAHKHKTVTYYAEIVSGSNFGDAERLYVNYRLKVPRGWELRAGNLNDGAANMDGTTVRARDDNDEGGGSGAQKGAIAAVRGRVGKLSAQKSLLRGTTQTAAVTDTPLGTSGRLSLLRPRYKGVPIPHTVSSDPCSRMVFGLSLWVISIAAFVVGVDYPFWIVPALAILFALLYGTPGGRVQVALLKRKSDGAAHSGASRSKKGQSRLAYNEREVVDAGGCISDTVAVFNHPLSFSFDLRDDEDAAVSLASVAPVIQFQVFSAGWFGRHQLQGYGYLTLSTDPASSSGSAGGGGGESQVRTWRPVGGVHARMADFFLGSSVRLRDDDFADHSAAGVADGTTLKTSATSTKKGTAALNRFGFLTEKSGTLRVRSQVIVSDPRIVAAAQLAREQTATGGGGGGGNGGLSGTLGGTASNPQLRRTVQDILQTFKATSSSSMRSSFSGTGLRASFAPGGSAAESPASAASSSKPSVLNILAALGSNAGGGGSVSAADQSKASKVAEILARARAKTAQAAAKRTGGDSNSSADSGAKSSGPYDPHIERKTTTTSAADDDGGDKSSDGRRSEGKHSESGTPPSSSRPSNAAAKKEPLAPLPSAATAGRPKKIPPQPQTARELSPRIGPDDNDNVTAAAAEDDEQATPLLAPVRPSSRPGTAGRRRPGRYDSANSGDVDDAAAPSTAGDGYDNSSSRPVVVGAMDGDKEEEPLLQSGRRREHRGDE